MKRCLLGLFLFVCFAGTARADVVTLKNGDRVTGTLVTVKGKTLQLKSEILGTLNIPLEKVATYAVEKPVAVVVKGKKPVEGTLELAPSGDWQVKTAGQAQTIAAATVDTIMPADTYHSLVEVTPKPWQAWKGSAAVGESIQHGNQQTNTLTSTISMVHERPAAPIFKRHLRTNFSFTGLFSQSNQDSSFVTSHTLSSNLRQDILISPRDFLFGMGQFDHISTSGLYLRQTLGGGFGTDVIQKSRTTLSLSGGMTYQHQKFINGTWTEGASALVGEKFGEQFTKRLRMDQNFNIYPDFSHLGQYRFDTSTIIALKLSNRFSFNASAIDLFLSTPPPGNQRNNITLSTGLGYTF